MRYLLVFIIFMFGCKLGKNINEEYIYEYEKINLSEKNYDLEDTYEYLEPGRELTDDYYITTRSIVFESDEYISDEYVVNNEIITISDRIKEIDRGQIIYKVPDTMQVLKRYYVIVRISESGENTQITENINGRITHRNIKTSSRMEVNLIDYYNAFRITKINNDRQLVDSTYTEWKFSVIPLKPGINKLNLIVSTITGDDLKQIVYSDEIFVKSNTPAQIKIFWYENWKWYMEKILIPLITWLIGIWIGKRKKA